MIPSRAFTPFALLFALLAAPLHAASRGPDVLFLNSYHPGLIWSDNVMKGLRGALHPHEQLAVEFLDSKHGENPHQDSLLATLLMAKYRNRQPRIILSSDDYALLFLFHWRDRLFPGVPVVFCGINNFKPEMLAGKSGYTGLGELNRMPETVTMVRQLLESTTDIWFVTERSATGTGNRLRLDSLASHPMRGITYHFFDSAGTPSWDELRNAIRSLGPGNVVYWSEFYQDRNGLYVDIDQDLGLLFQESPVPIFAHQEQFILAGATGGLCNRGVLHGQQAGRLMRRVLDGATPDSLPVESDSSVAPLFDWFGLVKFGIVRDDLPAERIVLGEPIPVWTAYPIQTTSAALILVALGAMAIGLSEALRRARLSREQLQASEATLRSSEDELRRIFDSLSDGVMVHSPDGSIEFMNAGGFRMFQISEQDLPRLDVAMLSADRCLRQHDLPSILERAFQGENLVFQWTSLRPFTQEEFQVEVSLAPLNLNGRNRIVAVVRDIGERLETQRLLVEAKATLEKEVQERTRALVQSNKELEAFAYSVSHDLRTPLRSVNGFAQALQEDLSKSLSAEHSDFLARIRAASTRMSDIIDDLLHLSRITTTSLDRCAVDMLPIVQKCQSVLIDSAPGIKWTIGRLPSASGDPALLKPLWSNLLSNAVKYSAKTTAPHIEIGAVEQDGKPVWFVRDNGAGFDMAHAHHLFEPFRRLHHTHEFAGTGIGLAIVHRVVTRHGGRVWAEAKLGEGATFYFTLG